MFDYYLVINSKIIALLFPTTDFNPWLTMFGKALIFVLLWLLNLQILIQFYKYQGTGNDFILIDNRDNHFDKNDTKLINRLCDRRFGIGADGLILLENDNISDFAMVYFNSDGNQSTMCGNGGRCIVAFANKLGIIENKATFLAVDGMHYASIDNNIISLQMTNVDDIQVDNNYVFLDTGSPHHVEMVQNLSTLDVVQKGAEIRYGDLYGKSGSNVNFVEIVADDEFNLRTYERGVEDETFACGTGATATAIAMHKTGKTSKNSIQLNVKGGVLQVSFNEIDGKYHDIYLQGAATFVFKGEIA